MSEPRIPVAIGPCVEYDGAKDRHGYGAQRDQGKVRRAHVVAWEAKHGPVPEGLELDHLCSNPPCIKTTHLQAVTHAENLRRAWVRGRMKNLVTAKNKAKTHCNNGHEFTPENTGVASTGDNHRYCKTCSRERAAAQRARKKEAIAA